jgi:hypothetical protein
MKKKRACKKDSGLFSGIEREEWSDIGNQIIYGSAEWRILNCASWRPRTAVEGFQGD